LLAIPTIIGAELVEFRNVIDAGSHGVGFVPLLLGFLGAFISGWIAIKIFMEIIHRTSIRGFAYYCFAAGSLVLFFSILR
jgi:undecaprenyl-diphosphatase